MKSRSVITLTCLMVFMVLFTNCELKIPFSIHDRLSEIESLTGKSDYLKSPYVAAGDRVYVVGHQNGSFPDLGWHVQGEMGGIWDHPIKLLDGFGLSMGVEGQAEMCLPAAEKFENFPYATRQIYPTIDGVAISQMTLVPDSLEGVIVEYRLINTLANDQSIALGFDVFVDLRPVWLAERESITDGRDGGYWDQSKQQLVVKDSLNSWFTVISSSEDVHQVTSIARCSYKRKGLGVDFSLKQEINLDAGESKVIRYYIGGSYKDQQSAIQTNHELKAKPDYWLTQKQQRYQSLQSFNQLKTSDSGIDRMYQWVRYNTQWLIREVPEEGRGLSAGIPDYPWWFGTDNGYAIEGMLAYGMFEEALSTIDLILKLSDKANGSSGQVMHEASTNGVVFNPGNLNTTPRFVETLWMTYSWTGSDSLLQAYWPRVKMAIDWIAAQDRDGNGYPDGPGMMEIQGLHTEMIDVIAYQAQAYQAAASFAYEIGEDELFNTYQEKARFLSERINKEWWSEEFQSFADFRATKKQAIDLTEAAIIRADTINKPWSEEELKETLKKIKYSTDKGTQPYVVHHNWVVNTPMEVGVADPKLAHQALATAKRYKNRFGMFVTGIDRDEEQEAATQWKSFSYVGAVMTLPTGVQAIASARYGYIDDTFDYLKNLENSFGYALPGSMYEVSPDFGMIAQAWNSYAVAVPIVQYIGGIVPEAHQRRIRFQPQLPDSLNTFRLSNVRVGENIITLQLDRNMEELIAQIEQSQPDWGIWIPTTDKFSYEAEKVEVLEDGLLLKGPQVRIVWQ